MRAAPGAKTGWERFARRARVPLGFCVAAVCLVFAQPSAASMADSLIFVISGLWLRGYAAGYVKKNSELTRTGPYAYTRNPLYFGSWWIALGFAFAANRWWLFLLITGLFALIYIPTILSEETFLRGAFPAFQEYARAVPRFMPRLTPARWEGVDAGAGEFQPERYRHHREYNALVGSVAIYAALGLRMWFAHRH